MTWDGGSLEAAEGRENKQRDIYIRSLLRVIRPAQGSGAMGVILVAMFRTLLAVSCPTGQPASTVDELVDFGYWLRTSAGSINGPVTIGLEVVQGPPSRATIGQNN